MKRTIIINKKLNRKNKKNKRKVKINKTINPMHVMRAVAIATYRVSCNLGSSTNGNINLNDDLVSTDVFTTFKNLYQYYKVSFVEIITTPSPGQGTLPPVGYSILKGNEDVTFDQNKLATNPLARKVNNNKVTYMKFTRPGRNADFNYWYNTPYLPTEAACSVLYHFAQPISSDSPALGYTFRVKWHLKFSNFYIKSAGTKELENEIKRDDQLQSGEVREELMCQTYEELPFGDENTQSQDHA
jgi:hypothetical protein